MQILWCPVMHPLLLPIFISCYWGWTGTPELFFNVFIVWGLACYTCSFISDLCSWTQIDTLFALSLYISTLTHVVPLAERRHAFPVSQRKPAAIFSFQQCLVTPLQLLLLFQWWNLHVCHVRKQESLHEIPLISFCYISIKIGTPLTIKSQI